MTYDQFLIAFALLNLVDVLTTISILKRGGVELNPVLRKAMQKIGVMPALVLFKAALIGLFIHYPAPLEAQAFVLALYVAVVGNNLRVMRKM